MSDRPPDAGTTEPAAGDSSSAPGEGTAAADRAPLQPAVPAIDLSAPEHSGPPAPLAVGAPTTPATGGSEAVPDEDAVGGEGAVGSDTAPLDPSADPPPTTDAATAPMGGAAPPAAGGPEAAGGGSSPSRPPVALIGIAVALLVVLVVALVLVKSLKDKSTSTTTTSSTTTVNTTPVSTAGWVTSTDEASGFTVKHPKDWKVTGPAAGQNRLLLTAGQQNFLLITAREIDPSTVADVIAQAMAAQSVISGPTKVTISGLPGVLYIYKSPTTTANPVAGVIVHYFVVRGSKMYSLIFQARPEEELNRLARTYDAVAKSFVSTSDAPAPDTIPESTTVTTG